MGDFEDVCVRVFGLEDGVPAGWIDMDVSPPGTNKTVPSASFCARDGRVGRYAALSYAYLTRYHTYYLVFILKRHTPPSAVLSSSRRSQQGIV